PPAATHAGLGLAGLMIKAATTIRAPTCNGHRPPEQVLSRNLACLVVLARLISEHAAGRGIRPVPNVLPVAER
ncbi:hypothetical protein, partial [uncultured Lamprocystis sp.]